MKKLIVAAIVPKVNLLAKFNRFPRCKDGDVYKMFFIIGSIKELTSRGGEEVTR